MKDLAMRFTLSFLPVAALLVHVVEGTSRKPEGRSTVGPKIGWRYGNGPCMCTGILTPTLTPGLSHPSGPHPSRPHPSGPHPSRLHPSGPHPSRPHPSRPHPSRPHPSRPHPSRPHPSGPHPSGPHPSRPHPSGHHPSGHHPSRPHPSRPHPSRPHPSRPHPSWPHPSGPHPSWPHPSGPHPSGPHPSGPHPSGPHPSGPHPSGPHPSGPHPSRPHPSGPHPSRPHPSGPHPSRPHTSGPHPSWSHPSRPHQSGSHPSRPHPSRPHPSGPHPSRPHPSGPHPSGPHPSRPHPSRLHPFGPHPSRPHAHSTQNRYTPCICRKRAEKIVKIILRMLKEWKQDYGNKSTQTYKQERDRFVEKISKALKIEEEAIRNVIFTQGSIVAQFEVVYTSQSSGNGSNDIEDPEKALRNAIQSGQLEDLQIDPGSLVVSESFAGVNLTSWITKSDECSFKCHDDKHDTNVEQSRECTEVTAKCDGVPLTRETSCDEACPKYSSEHESKKEVFIIVGILIAAIVVVVVGVVIILKCKRDRRKKISPSPSIGSMKQLKDNDQLQSRC